MSLIIFISVEDPFHFHPDPLRGITDPDPSLNEENSIFLTLFTINNIFLKKINCFVIYKVNIYVR